MHQLDINCDMGEGIGNEHQLMPYVQSCNIACGGHAGSELLMKEIVTLAMKYKVKIGAHPSYPDIDNFGRRSMKISASDLSLTILNQIDSLHRIVVNCGGRMNHIKAHGALYNDMLTNEQLAIEFLNIIEAYKKDIKLFVPYQSVIARIAVRDGFNVVYEAFVDRNYNNDLSLVSRNDENALITDPKIMLDRVVEIKDNGTITTITGEQIPIRAGTFCLHSDTKNIVECLKYLNQNLN